MSILTIEHLQKVYTNGFIRRKRINALKDVSLSVEQGEIFGLLGPNGAGKTTLVKILLSIVHPTRGSGTLLSHPIGTTAVRKEIGYLPENHRYPGFLTAADVMKFSGGLKGLNRAAIKTKSDELLELVGLKDWRKVKVKKFSKGMLQRLGIAEAMIADPSVLFLDEPTDGVDPIGRKEIRDLLKRLRDQGKTIFLNSHILAEVELICNRVAVLHKGDLLKVGTVDSITNRALEYEFRTASPLPQELIDQIRTHATSVTIDGNLLTLGLRSKETTGTIVQMIAKSGILLESFEPRKLTLEDSFVEIIKSSETVL
jgi:ABC-2 type transport system ATP-binding protein